MVDLVLVASLCARCGCGDGGDGEVMIRSFALVCRSCRAMMAGASAPRILLGKVDSGGKANVGTAVRYGAS